MSKGPIALVIGILAIAIASGCGGSSGSSGGEISTSSLSREEFVAEADAACSRGQDQAEHDLFLFMKKNHFKLNEVSKNPNERQVKGLVKEVLIPAVEREIAAIRALGAPSGEEGRVEAILVAIEEGIETAEDLPRKALEETSVPFGIGSRLAKEYGLRVCGQR